jgi:hypothetical protein
MDLEAGMNHSPTLIRETAAPAQPLRWIASRAAPVNGPTLRRHCLATVPAVLTIALLLPPTAAVS